MRVIRLLVAAALLAVPLLAANPAGAQQAFTVTGEATCNTDDGTYTLSYELESFVGFPGDITSAELSGAATGSVTFSPDPIPADGTSTGSIDIPGDTTGTVTLTVVINFKGDIDETFDIELAGDCEAPATTTTTTTTVVTTTTAAAQPVTLQPSFTG